MNKIYTSTLAAVLLAGTTMAQTKALSSIAPLRHGERSAQPLHTPPGHERGSTIWSDDFSDPATWAMGHDGTQALDWQVGVGLMTQGAAPIAAIQSTTAANGYGMVDSDFFGNVTTNYEQAWLSNVSPIDLMGFPDVVLEFQNQYRKWTDEECYVVVQVGNTGWPVLDPTTDISAMPNVFKVWPGMQTQDPVANPTVRRIDISAVAGGQSNVYVRFYWSGIFGYAWFVDDVSIQQLPPYELVMMNGFLSHNNDGSEFGRIPSTQLNADMQVGGQFQNLGSLPQTNCHVQMDVVNQSLMSVFTASYDLAALAPGDTGTMDLPVTLPVLTNGIYTATFTVSSTESAGDAFPDNNVFLRTFEVTTNTYSLDEIGDHPPGYETLSSLGTASFTGGEDGLIFFTYYPIHTDMTVYGLEFDITASTLPGATVNIGIYDTSSVVVLSDLLSGPIASTTDYTITQADVDAGKVKVGFNPPAVLAASSAYYASVEMYSNTNTYDVRIIDDETVPQPANASVIYIPADQVYTNGNAFSIRMSSDPNFISGIEENELHGVSVYPNPAHGTVTLNAPNAETYTVEITNVLGETSMTSHVNGNATMDLSNLANGVYTVRVSNAKAAMVQRITLN